MAYTMPKSKRGARRQYDALMRQYRRDYVSGGAFGFDWPTLRANRPALYYHLQEMNEAFRTLPD